MKPDRELETREAESRVESWKPPSLLPDPTPSEDWVYRWVRKSVRGESDPSNVSIRMREGWVIVRAEDHPDVVLEVAFNESRNGTIEMGGLILCKADRRAMESRNRYYETMTSKQTDAVNNNLMKENDSRMPLFQESKTKVSFGTGT
tara:strand:- start:345 stop:785 length:441 start_codon:yes stop_codon:yes gene_type:complete